jgi:predicted negative regulator of RcsB-dependent stress response
MNQNQEPDMLTRWITNNVAVLLTGAILTGGGIAGYTSLQNKVEYLDAYREERTKLVDTKLAEIGAAAAAMPNLVYRVAAAEEALKATNARVDVSLTNISARLAEINQGLGSLSTQVAVLTQRFDQSGPERRSSLQTPR